MGLDAGDAAPKRVKHLQAPLANIYAYVPPQCYTKTRASTADMPGGGTVHNPCFVCHTKSEAPNYANDGDLQISLKLPTYGARDNWANLFDPPVLHGERLEDDAVLARVRAGNYFDEHGKIALAEALKRPEPTWDENGDGLYGGYAPDAYFHFDERGFDHAPDGSATGWRSFAYTPFPGTFFPTNGSIDDVLVRLDPRLRRAANGQDDEAAYVVNLAVVEALLLRADVPLDPVDERSYRVDLDLDGALGTAAVVRFDKARMHYVGAAKEGERDLAAPLERIPGLFPVNTEFLHSVRYLDVDPQGGVVMAPRMKELRYAKKFRFLKPEVLARIASMEPLERVEWVNDARPLLWQMEAGISNDQGWLYSGFIESADGNLRPQTFEETAFCMGCHGEIGATTDTTFAFARKLGAGAYARGWSHPTTHEMAGTPEPKRRDGTYEYTEYLRQNGAGDELRANTEVEHRFFRSDGTLRPEAIEALHRDVSALLLPSASRAIALDRAYLAIVRDQSFVKGRDAVLAPATNVYDQAPVGAPTGITKALTYR